MSGFLIELYCLVWLSLVKTSEPHVSNEWCEKVLLWLSI